MAEYVYMYFVTHYPKFSDELGQAYVTIVLNYEGIPGAVGPQIGLYFAHFCISIIIINTAFFIQHYDNNTGGMGRGPLQK